MWVLEVAEPLPPAEEEKKPIIVKNNIKPDVN